MKTHARFDSLARLALLVALATSLAACKKPEVPTPTTPEPKAAQTEVTQSDAGTTTTYAPPAAEPQAPANAAQ
jgi:hypothetical protein